MNQAVREPKLVFVMLVLVSITRACDQPVKAVTLFDAVKKGYDRLKDFDLGQHLDWIVVCEFEDFKAHLTLSIEDQLVIIKREGDSTNADVDITDDGLQHQDYDQKWCADVFVSFIPLFPHLVDVSLTVDPDDFHIDWNMSKLQSDYNFGRCHAVVKTVDGTRGFNVYVDFGWADAYNYIREWVGYNEITASANTFEV